KAKYPHSTTVHRAAACLHTRAGAGWPLADGSPRPFVDGDSAGATPFGVGSCRPLPSVAAAPAETPFFNGGSADSTPCVDGGQHRLTPFVDGSWAGSTSFGVGSCRPLPSVAAAPAPAPFGDGGPAGALPFVDGGSQRIPSSSMSFAMV